MLIVRIRAEQQIPPGVEVNGNLLRDILVEVELMTVHPAACFEGAVLAPLGVGDAEAVEVIWDLAVGGDGADFEGSFGRGVPGGIHDIVVGG